MTVSGDLNQRIVFQQRDPNTNALREQSKAWIDYTPDGVWAQVMPLRVRDRFQADQQHSEIDVVFRIRRRTDITDKMRIIWDGAPYDIQGRPKNVKGKNAFLDIECISGVRDGR